MFNPFPKITPQKTIEITNAIELSAAYLKRFFQKAGPVQQVVKDTANNIVYIEFKHRHSIQRALAFNNRVLDKKPVAINVYSLLPKNVSQQQKPFQKTNSLKPQRIQITSVIKLPCLHEFKPQQIPKLPIRSEYRLIDHSDTEQHQINFQNNPLEGIQSKAQLWKIIITDLSRHVNQPDPNSKQLILSAALGIWALIQLKVQQINFLSENKQNMKSKYIQNIIEEIVINKLNSLQNPNIIHSSNKFKTVTNQHTVEFAFSVSYPELPQQEEKFLCDSNQKIHKLMCILYLFSPLVGKIYHQLHTNALILYENPSQLMDCVQKFYDQTSISFTQKISAQQAQQAQQKPQNEKNVSGIDQNMKFIGFIENYGQFFFQNLSNCQMTNHSNSIIWLQVKDNKIQGPYPYPGFFYCNSLFEGCKDKILHQSSFFNLYTVENKSLLKRQSHKFQNCVMVFQDGQFTLKDCVNNTLSYLRFELRNSLYQKKDSMQQEQNFSIQLQMNLDLFYVGINIKNLERHIIQTQISLNQCVKQLESKFALDYSTSKPKLNVRLCFIQILPEKQKQFNAFKCQNYLINHIDKQFIAKNSIIASEQFAQKVAQKLLEETSAKELFGFKDKKYLGSEIWRLYNKSGARRAKLKISQYNFKKHKSE